MLSTALVIIFFYYVKMFDSVLKHVFELVMTEVVELRVETEDFVLDLWNKKCEVKGFIVYHPSVEEDPRWHYEYMIYVKDIIFNFDPVQTLYAFCKSGFSLLYVHEIAMTTIDLYVEGFDEEIMKDDGTIGTKKLLNLELLGGLPVNGKSKRKKQPTQSEINAILEEQQRKYEALQREEFVMSQQEAQDSPSSRIHTVGKH